MMMEIKNDLLVDVISTVPLHQLSHRHRNGCRTGMFLAIVDNFAIDLNFTY
jgi:hypothetical protein